MGMMVNLIPGARSWRKKPVINKNERREYNITATVMQTEYR